MAQVTIYKDAAVSIQVFDGTPPADQSAQVTALTAQVATLTATNVALTTANAALTAKIDLARVDVAKIAADLA